MRQRHCAGMLAMMGMKGTIAFTVYEYIGLAVELGLNQKLKIAANKHLVYRDGTCIAAIEDFLHTAIKEMTRNDYR
jgi:hypothetical protein